MNYLNAINELEAKIKVANHLIRIDELDREISKYDLNGLKKAASLGYGKEDRIKVAALIRQREIEKQALLSGLVRTGLAGLNRLGSSIGSGIQSAANTADKYINNAGNYVRSGINDAYNAGSKAMNNMYYRGMRAFNRAAQPFRSAGAAVQGFGQGLAQGARSLANTPRAVGNALRPAANALYQGFTGNLANGIPKSGSDKTADLRKFVKFASSLSRIYRVEDELSRLNLNGLKKSASLGYAKDERIKAAALVRQREIEKQAFVGLVRSLGI